MQYFYTVKQMEHEEGRSSVEKTDERIQEIDII